MSRGTRTLDDVPSLARQLPQADKLRLISLLWDDLRNEIERDGAPVDMLSLAGLGAEIWREIDVDAYLAQERSNWQG